LKTHSIRLSASTICERRDSLDTATMKKKPTLTQWRHAYALADRIHALAPWNTLADCDTFGLRSGKQTRYCCVMGNAGDHYAVMVYNSVLELSKVSDAVGTYGDPMDLLSVACAQVSFESQDWLDADDLALMKRIGYQPQAPALWPQFRARTDWHHDSLPFADELTALVDAMDMILAEAPGMSEEWLEATDEIRQDREWYIYSRDKKAPETWQRTLESIPPVGIHFPVPSFDIGDMAMMPQDEGVLEIDLNGMASSIQNGRDGRLMIPMLLTAVDGNSGMAITHAMATADKDPIAPWLEAPELVLKAVFAMKERPKRIIYRHELMAVLLGEVSQQLGITLEQRATLPRTTDMLAAMNEEM
jgi:hypothetical protein